MYHIQIFSIHLNSDGISPMSENRIQRMLSNFICFNLKLAVKFIFYPGN